MRGSKAKEIREIIGLTKKGEHPMLDRLYKRTKKQYSRLSWNVRSDFLAKLKQVLHEQ